MQTIADRVREILPEAIEHVSSGGKMKFGIRSLWYAVIERFRKKWPGDKFYEYNSFTQDFLRAYEKEHGKIPGLIRGPRGMSCSVDAGGFRVEEVVKPEIHVYQGIGNKILVVEKLELYEVMKENNFDKRLDCILLSTQGFTTEAGREALLQIEEAGLPVCILHDWDVNGVLIKETLTKPTKRLDTEINPGNLVDVGLNYDVVKSLMETRGLTPEPMTLSSQDLSKLEGMLERGEISQEEYEFLQSGRIELNALTPLELLEWLEKRLEELDLWKTVPEQDELDETMKDQMISDLDGTKRKLVDELREIVEDELGLTKLWDALYIIRDKLESRLDAEISDRMKDMEYPTKDLDEFKEEMRQNMEKYWKALAEEIAESMAGDLADPVVEKVEEQQDDIVNEGMGDPDVEEAKSEFAGEVRTWLQNQD